MSLSFTQLTRVNKDKVDVTDQALPECPSPGQGRLALVCAGPVPLVVPLGSASVGGQTNENIYFSTIYIDFFISI
jgi:hypothetical protein